MTWHERGLIAEAFEESLLPMRVEVLELPMTDPEFVDRIQRDFVPMQSPRFRYGL